MLLLQDSAINDRHTLVADVLESVALCCGPLDQWINRFLFGIPGELPQIEFLQPRVQVDGFWVFGQGPTYVEWDQDFSEERKQAEHVAYEFSACRRFLHYGINITSALIERDASNVDLPQSVFLNLMAVHESTHDRMTSYSTMEPLGIAIDAKDWRGMPKQGHPLFVPVRQAHEEIAQLAMAAFPWDVFPADTRPTPGQLRNYFDYVARDLNYQTFRQGQILVGLNSPVLLQKFRKKHPLMF